MYVSEMSLCETLGLTELNGFELVIEAILIFFDSTRPTELDLLQNN